MKGISQSTDFEDEQNKTIFFATTHSPQQSDKSCLVETLLYAYIFIPLI